MSENPTKISKERIKEAFRPFKNASNFAFSSFPVFNVSSEAQTVLLPQTTINPSLAEGTIIIDKDSIFFCQELFIIYDSQIDFANDEFIRIKFTDAVNSRLIMRDFIDIRNLGSPGQHNLLVLAKNLWQNVKGLPFQYVFREGSQLKIEVEYFHNVADTKFVNIILKGLNVLKPSLFTGVL